MIFSTNLIGYIFVFKIQQYQVRREIIHNIKNGIPEEALHCILVNQENIKAILWKDKKEFRYKGQMYDVVKQEQIDANTTRYYCIIDSKETLLFHKLQEHLNRNGKSKNHNIFPVKIVFHFLPKSQYNSVYNTREFLLQQQKTNFKYLDCYTSPEIEIASPPPQSV